MSNNNLTERQLTTLSNKLTRHAKNNCANYIKSTNECALYGKCKIPIYFASLSTTEHYRCNYFESSVLPSEPTLLDEYKRRYNEQSNVNIKYCQSCQKGYTPNSNNQKYCKPCADNRRREQDRIRKQKRRLNEATEHLRNEP